MQRSYHHGDLRNALLSASEQLLVEKGIDGLSLREVARTAGVSPNAPYRHFESKDALLIAIAERGFATLRDRFRAIPESKPKARFLAMAEAYVGFAAERTQVYRVMFSGRFGNFEQHPELARTSAETMNELVLSIWPLLDSPSHQKASQAAVAVWSMLHGYSSLLLDGVMPPSEQAKPTTAELGKILLDGLKRWS